MKNKIYKLIEKEQEDFEEKQLKGLIKKDKKADKEHKKFIEEKIKRMKQEDKEKDDGYIPVWFR